MIIYERVEGTVWPVNVGPREWVQRYGIDADIHSQRFFIASIIGAYRHLIDPSITQTEAIASLKRARKAQANAVEACPDE